MERSIHLMSDRLCGPQEAVSYAGLYSHLIGGSITPPKAQ